MSRSVTRKPFSLALSWVPMDLILPNSDLVRLVRHILSETDLVRLRVSSLQPQEIGPEFLSLWSNSRLCPHFHLPLQSGSDTVLKRMRRRYCARLYEETVAMIRARIPDASITTDVIVGFPGETDSDFGDTYALCERVGFASMHVFPYSKRPGTSAAHYGSQVAANIKSERVQSLLGLAEREAARFREQFLGKERPGTVGGDQRDKRLNFVVWPYGQLH